MATKKLLSAVITTDGKLSSLEKKDGQLIFIKDQRTIALDFNGIRTVYSSVIPVSTDAERESILAPIHGLFYYVIKTNCLWQYDGGWIQITSPPKDIIYKCDTFEQLPSVGNETTLYILKDENKTYRWDDIDVEYYCVGSDYNDIKTINGGGA